MKKITADIDIGGAIKIGLKRKKLSVKKFAEEIGASPVLVYKWLKNERTPPGDDLIAIAMFLGIETELFPKKEKNRIQSIKATKDLEKIKEKIKELEKELNNIKE